MLGNTVAIPASSGYPRSASTLIMVTTAPPTRKYNRYLIISSFSSKEGFIKEKVFLFCEAFLIDLLLKGFEKKKVR